MGRASRLMRAFGALRPMLGVPNITSGVFVYCEHMTANSARITIEGVKSSTRLATFGIMCVRAEMSLGWNVTDGRVRNWGASNNSN